MFVLVSEICEWFLLNKRNLRNYLIKKNARENSLCIDDTRQNNQFLYDLNHQ